MNTPACGNLRAILDAIDDAVLRTDRAGMIRSANASAHRLFRCPEAGLIGRSVDALLQVADDDPAPLHRPVSALADGVCRQATGTPEAGSSFAARVTVVSLNDPHGDAFGRCYVVRDLTETMAANARLEAGDQRLRLMIQAAPEAILLYDADRDTFIDANPMAETLFETDRRQLLAVGPRHFYTSDQPDGQPTDATFDQHNQAALDGRQVSFRRKIRTASGRERICEMRLIALPFEGNRLIRASFIDVTESQEFQRAILEERSKFQSLVEQEIAGVCIVRADGGLAYVNHCFAQIFGQQPDDMTGRSLLQFLPAESAPNVGAMIRDQVLGEGRPAQLLSQVSRKDGSTADVLINASKATYGGEPVSLAVILDITEQRYVLRELEFASLIIEQSPVIAFQSGAGPEFAWEYVSRNVARFGFTADECLAGGFRFPDFVHPEDRVAVLAGVQSVAEAKVELFDQDIRIIARDGAVVWVHCRAIPLRDGAGAVTGYRGTLVDITERVGVEQRVRRINRTLRTLNDAGAALVRAKTESELLSNMCRVLVETGGYLLAWVAYAEHDPQRSIRPVASFGQQADYLDGLALSWADCESGLGPAGSAIRTGQAQVNRDFAANPAVRPWRDECLARGFGSSAALPLTDGETPFGAIVLVSDAADAFDDDEMGLLMRLAADVSHGVSSLRVRATHDSLAEQLQQSMEAAIGAMASMLDARDPYTAGHQRRVATLAVAIGQKLRLTDSRLHGLRLASTIHDIGKISVPAEILNKPGKLSALEFALIKQHVEAGYQIIKDVDFPWPISQMILQHHERLDGSGYPNGLHGSEILLEAQIIAVADVVDAMHSFRPYRPALGIEIALAEIEAHQGSRFDPGIVAACVDLFRKGGFSFNEA